MCGIYGVITSKGSCYSNSFLKKALNELASLSETRGRDSSGLCVFNQDNNSIEVVRGPIPTKQLFNHNITTKMIDGAFSDGSYSKYAFGHSRLVTNGTQLNNQNNQPVIKSGIVGVHNGIITNDNQLWKKNKAIRKESEIDTEILLGILDLEINSNKTLSEVVSNTINKIDGTVASAIVFDSLDMFLLTTNNGSLYTIHNNNDILFFASEYNMLNKFQKKINLKKIGEYSIDQISSNNYISINLDNFLIKEFSFEESYDSLKVKKNIELYPIKIRNIDFNKKQLSTVIDINQIHLNANSEKERSLLKYPIEKIKKLARCSKCILPSTFPFIYFDDKMICNYCHNYKSKSKNKSIDELIKLVEPYRRSNRKPEVLIPLSGGRDSTYVLHVIKKELNMNVVTYTYDWGMVTDLARRNIARICGKLGVENIIVAADMHWKRNNIRKNIIAWLKNPNLGMIPLFMAGDKFFFYYSNKIKKQLGIDLEIWGVNELENTNFKTGFAGLKPQFNKKRIYSISALNQLKLFFFVGKNIFKSPRYINQSMLDSLGSYASRYITPKTNYYHLFDYIEWDEKIIEDTIINHYNWEQAIDTNSTWRIGDGTASFYNYIYTLIAGFSENDTFRSNQIREGMINRTEALDLIYEENKPRYNSLKWYLEIVGLDFESTINTINQIDDII